MQIVNSPNWAEQLESIATAIAALFAISGFFIAWWSIKKDMSNQQDQITHLVSFTNALNIQTENVKESNKINSQILDKITQLLVADRVDNSTLKEYKFLEERRRKNDIKPYFIKDGGTGSIKELEISIKNVGEIAQIETIDIDKKNLKVSFFPIAVDKNERLIIKIGSKNHDDNMAAARYNLRIFFRDKDSNNYLQEYLEGGSGSSNLTEPVAIDKE